MAKLLINSNRKVLASQRGKVYKAPEGGGSGSSSVDIVKPIYAEQKIPVPNTGYLEKIFFNTKLTPEEFKSEENASDKEDFINLIKILLDQIYGDSDIPEYEKQHHEFVFLKIMDLFSTKDVEIIDKDSELYKIIELGFIRFDIELLKLNNSGDN